MTRRPLLLCALLALTLVAGAVTLRTSDTAHAADTTRWVNALNYGSVGGGFYWDTQSGQVWTAERGWHLYSPSQPGESTLWVNDLTYGSKGGGFYLDPLSNQVWTSERGWHFFSPGGTTPPPPPAPTATPTTPAGPTAKTFGNGTFIVGTDIQPGTYRTRVAASGCYWERMKAFTGTTSGDVIANDFTKYISVVTIAPTDKGFTHWPVATHERSPRPASVRPNPTSSDGSAALGAPR